MLIMLFILVAFPCQSCADYYKYLDDSGGENVTNDYNSIPERYRSGVTAVKESELRKKIQIRDNQVRDERAEAAKQRLLRGNSAPSRMLSDLSQPYEPQLKSDAGKLKKATDSVLSGKWRSHLPNVWPVLSFFIIVLLFFAASIIVGKLLAKFVPRTLGTIIKIVLFLVVAVYVFHTYSDRITKTFAVIRSEAGIAQKAVDKRSDRIEKQSADR